MFAVLALATGALAYNATTTVQEKVYTTIECSTPTTFAYGNSTYTVTEATTLTIEDCSCTATPTVAAVAGNSTSNSTSPAIVNGAQAAQVGVAAGVVAAVALLI